MDNSANLQTLQDCEQYIAAGQTERALKKLIKVPDSKFRRRFVSLSNQFNTLTRDHNKGTVSTDDYRTRSNQINVALLAALNDYDAHLKEEPSASETDSNTVLRKVLGVGVLVIAGLLLTKWYTDRMAPEVIQIEGTGCREYNRMIRVADFTPRDIDGFSQRLVGLVRPNAVRNGFKVGRAEFLNLAEDNHLNTIMNTYYSECDTSGIFVNGFLDNENKILECLINIINLDFHFGSETFDRVQTVSFRNPAQLEFNVASNAQFVADFVNCLTHYYSYDVENAIECFESLLLDPDLDNYPKFQGYIAMYRGNAHLMLGQEQQAIASYDFARRKNPVLEDLIAENERLIDKGLVEPMVVEIPRQRPNTTREGSTGETVEVTDNSFTTKNGHIYSFKRMKDGKVWMTHNLNLEVADSYCYDGQEESCQKYGRLYTWEAAKKACAMLGDGWRLPTDPEWAKMVKQYGGHYQDSSDKGKGAYQKLIEGGNGGFSALLGGWRYSNGSYYYLGSYGYYWSSTEDGSNGAWDYGFYGSDRCVYRGSVSKSVGYSVRCIQD